MQNVPIQGGRDTGAPRDWNAAELGPCLTISVLREVVDNMVYQTTAWQPSPEEMEALGKGGHLFFSINGPAMPVIRLWVQDDQGAEAGDLSSIVERDALMRAALLAIADVMQCRVPAADQVDLRALDTAPLLERMMELAQTGAAVDVMAKGIATLPIMTLGDVAKGGRRRGKRQPIAGAPVDQATQTDLEKRLGVELEPDKGDDP